MSHHVTGGRDGGPGPAGGSGGVPGPVPRHPAPAAALPARPGRPGRRGRGWTATIARHRALDHLRRAARRPPQAAVPAEDLASWPAADDTAQHAIDAALALIATLPPDQAEAVLLRAVLGLDAQTAGHVLGKRPGAVRTAAYRGLRTLARHLETGTQR